MLDAILWTKSGASSVECFVCGHHCRLKNGARGKCGVRINKNGRLVSVVTDLVSSVQMDPIEKKPLYHFLPGTKSFSMGSISCNFTCKFCQNNHLSVIPKSGVINGRRTMPDALVEMALQHKARSISFTYNEPTISVELVSDVSNIAQKRGLPCILVSNGYMSSDFINCLRHNINACNIDLKSFRDSFYREYCGARLQPVLDALIKIREVGWWLEVTTLVIPNVNDSPEEIRDCARFIKEELGEDVPWHLTAFHGAYKMQGHPSTTLDQLQAAWLIGKEEGLHYVYMGNVVVAVGGSTFCPKCSSLVAERSPWKINFPTNGRCPSCGFEIPGVWR